MSSPAVNIFTLNSQAGIKRDGTDFDSDFYRDGQWVRFQRGRPRKMGGYVSMSAQLSGPIRNVYVDARATGNTAHCFSPWAVEQLTFDRDGNGAGIIDRTPSGRTYNVNSNWQSDAIFNAGGGGNPVLVVADTPDLDSIASDATGGIYSGIITDTAALTQVSDSSGPILVSGGCVAIQPFLFVYGSNGLIRNSNANDLSSSTGWSGTLSVTGNFSATKIVRGLPVRGGASAPSGLFWALDTLIKVSFIGGTTFWSYDPIGELTVLSKNSIIEYDGIYYWVGTDRFYAYTGVIQELPNEMNSNYFFDNLNYAAAQKVWAMKVPRFGEIWWFYPSGMNTECDRAVIWNTREKTWYDAVLARSSGVSAQTFRFPVMTGGELQPTTFATYTAGSGVFNPTEKVTGGTSGATGNIARLLPGKVNLTSVVGTFVNGETITGAVTGATGTLSSVPAIQQLDTLWTHEKGYDRVKGPTVDAIQSYFETNNFQWQTGGPAQDVPYGAANSTRLTQLEPDFISTGPVSVTVRGGKTAQSTPTANAPQTFDNTTEFMTFREQRRQMTLRFESNTQGGYYEGGRTLVTVEPGDLRK